MIAKKAYSIGFRSGEKGGRKKSLQSSHSENVSIVSAWVQYVHTSIIFNKCMHLFRMMYVAIVQNEDASRTQVRIGKRDLCAALAICSKTKHVLDKKMYHYFTKELKEAL